MERDEGKKEELKEISSTFDVRSRETTATILLARKREANILKMIAFSRACLLTVRFLRYEIEIRLRAV